MGPKSFSRVSKSVHGHSKSATCTYYFCNILFLICFNILHLNAEKRQAVTAALITKARNLKNDLGCHWSGMVREKKNSQNLHVTWSLLFRGCSFLVITVLC